MADDEPDRIEEQTAEAEHEGDRMEERLDELDQGIDEAKKLEREQEERTGRPPSPDESMDEDPEDAADE